MRESRTRRASRLLLLSVAALREDPKLFVFPAAAAAGGLLAGALSLGLAATALGAGTHPRLVILLAAAIAAYPVSFVSVFCGVALAAVLAGRLDDEGASVGHGWSFARERLARIAGWTLLVCTVGAVLRPLEELVPQTRRLAHAALRVPWTPATLLAVPVLAYEELGPLQTLQRSAELFHRRWHEQMTGTAGTGAGIIVMLAPFALLVLAGLGIGHSTGIVLAAVGGAGIVAAGPMLAALDEVFRVFVYRRAAGLAEDGDSPFPRRDIERPFLPPLGRPARVRARATA